MKEQILKLRAEGKSYGQIAKLLNCNKSTVSYHCGDGIKEKARIRRNKKRSENPISRKIENFNRTVSEKGRWFQRRGLGKLVPRKEYNFNLVDILKKIGDEPICYLSGKPINLKDGKSYHFDHIIPASKGGLNTLDNLGIASASINKMKSDLSVEEFLNVCKEVLIFNGYEVIKS